ncbi:hypothetical protein TNCV_4168001 [Trichonephila clavipes]|nr:hypothetical protein TNCV_4168001 [Trichonephila clavipes]
MDLSVTSRTIAQHAESNVTQCLLRVPFDAVHAERFVWKISTLRSLDVGNHRRLHRQWCDEEGCGRQNLTKLSLRTSRHCLQHNPESADTVGERMTNSCVMHNHTGPAPGIMGINVLGYQFRLFCIYIYLYIYVIRYFKAASATFRGVGTSCPSITS